MQTTRSCSHAADKKENSPRQAEGVSFYAGGGGLPRTERQPAGLIARPAKQGRAVRPTHTPQIKKKTPPDKLGKFSFLCRWWGSNPHVLLAQGILSFRHRRSSGVIQCYLMILRSLLEFRFFTHLRSIKHQIFDFSLRFPSAPILRFGTSKRKLEEYLGGMQS